MCPSESEGFHLHSHGGDWWSKSTVYSSLREVVFIVLSVAYERIHAVRQDSWIFLLLQYEKCSYITGLKSV